jgi:transcription-repair coupling factor (superfamily II helicase)
LIDRFGSLPSPTQVLFELAQLRLTLQPLGVRRIEVNAQFGYIEFYEKHSIDPLKILKLIQEKPGIYQLQGNYKLRFSHMEKTAEGKIKFITELLTRIG